MAYPPLLGAGARAYGEGLPLVDGTMAPKPPGGGGADAGGGGGAEDGGGALPQESLLNLRLGGARGGFCPPKL